MTQWRKCRIPVATIAIPAASAAAIVSTSRIEPPGWMIAVAPAFAISCTPSANGKNASEPTEEPFTSSCAFITAVFTDSTRLVWPPPMAVVRSPFAKTIAFDFTCFTTFHAKRRSRHSCSVGARRVMTLQSSRRMLPRSRSITSSPPTIERTSRASSGRRLQVERASPRRGETRRRRFFFAARSARAPASYAGAMTHSRKRSVSSFAAASSTGRFRATMPPNAETGSQARARANASPGDAATATPHGVLCLMTTHAASSNSFTAASAASRSRRLL